MPLTTEISDKIFLCRTKKIVLHHLLHLKERLLVLSGVARKAADAMRRTTDV